MSLLVTGGAGFVGSRLSMQYKSEYPSEKVVVFDNLKRRGSELNLPVFKKLGIDFIHGDIRNVSDLNDIAGSFDHMIEASAEPSVHAGTDGNPQYLLQTNLVGTLNCLEYARSRCKKMIYLSTSRVYSINSLCRIPLIEGKNRFRIDTETVDIEGLSINGIDENFDHSSYRSLYGASKLSSEIVAQEYAETYNMDILINRCGVIAGPGQWGKVDQGVFTLWVINHFFNKPLAYTGFGGFGKQVRDLIHPIDLFSLINKQLKAGTEFSGEIYNVGGGETISTSLKELSAICQDVTGNTIEISSIPETAKVDIPFYVTNYDKVSKCFNWKPIISVEAIVKDIYTWLKEDEEKVRHIFN